MSRAFVLRSLILSSLYFTAVSAAETQIVFEGRYEFRADEESLEIIGKQVCFFPSAPSSQSVPRPVGDKRLPWFCFSNSTAAASELGFKMKHQKKSCGIQGAATVVVVGYTRYAGEGNGNDVARLKTVLNKTQPKPLPCKE